MRHISHHQQAARAGRSDKLFSHMCRICNEKISAMEITPAKRKEAATLIAWLGGTLPLLQL